MITRVKRKIKAYLPSNKIIQNILALSGGTAVVQLLLLLSTPIITRIYNPDALGALAVYVSILGIIGTISCLRYELAIPLPKDKADAGALVLLSVSILLLFVLLASIIILLDKKALSVFDEMGALEDYLWLLPIGLLLSGLYRIFSYCVIRSKQFYLVASTKIWQGISNLAAQMLLFKLAAVGLIISTVIGTSVGGYKLGRASIVDLDLNCTNIKEGFFLKLKQVAMRYWQFAIYSSPSALLNSLGRELPAIMIATYVGLHYAGLYGIAYRLLMAPITLVTTATSQVYLAHGVDAHRQGRIGELFDSIWQVSIKLFTIPIIMLALLAPYIADDILGSRWDGVGLLMTILCPWLLLIAYTNPLSVTVTILEKQGQALFFEVITVVLRVSGLVAGLIYGGFYLGVSLFIGGAVIGISCKLIWLSTIAKSNTIKSLRLLFQELIIGAGFASVGYILLESGELSLQILFGLICVMLLVRSVRSFLKGYSYA